MDLPYTLTTERRAQIGLIVLQSDETIEPDMRRLIPPEVELLVSRVPSGTSVSQDSLAAMESVLAQAASLLPNGARLSVTGYGCTSGTAQIGPTRISELVRAGVQTPKVTEPVSAVISACRALDLRKIGLISPYVRSVSDRLTEVLGTNGIEVPCFASFNEPLEENVARIAPDAIVAAACEMARTEEADVIFLSCTNLRTLDIIDEIEAETGKAVLSSNQVLAWNLLRLAGLSATTDAPGKLWNADADCDIA